MCGHFGIYSTELLKSHEKDFFMTLGILSTPRGKDATGFLAVENSTKKNKDGEDTIFYVVEKNNVEPYHFFNHTQPVGQVKGANHCLMGHNRHATLGGKTKEASHPFHHDNIIGAHNGTIRGYATEKNYISDSDKLFSRFNEIGVHESLMELPEDSAYALVWWNMDENAFYFFHNNQRTFFFSLSKDKKKVVWASEARFLTAALVYHEMIDQFEPPTSLTTNCLVKFSENKKVTSPAFGTIKWGVWENYLPKEVIDKHEKKTSYTSLYATSGYWYEGKWVGFDDGWDTVGTTKKEQDDWWKEYDKAKANGSITPSKDADVALVKGKTEESIEESRNEDRDEEKELTSSISVPITGEVKSSSATSFQYKQSNVWDQLDKRNITYTYWPINRKVSRRSAPSKYKELPSYQDYLPLEMEYAAELERCQRFIHNSNNGVFVTINQDDYTLTIHLPSGKIRRVSVDDARWDGWYMLMDKMLVDWNEATETARLNGTSSFNIRFYPWNAAHSFASVESGAMNDEDHSEPVETKRPKGKSRITTNPNPQEEVKTKRGRYKRKAGTLEERSAIDVADLEELPWGIADYYVGFEREELPLEEAERLLSCCCANCFEYNGLDDKVYWFNKNEYICEPCADLEIVQNHLNISDAYIGKRVEG